MKSIVSEKGQVTIPKPLRDSLAIGPGTELDFEEEQGKLVARRVVNSDPLASPVLLDVLTNSPNHAVSSLSALRAAREVGALIACPIVWAEIRGFFKGGNQMQEAFGAAGISFDPFDQECDELAGACWFEYRRHGGSRTRLVADFMIGAHAQVRGGRLVTRDRGFFRQYFSQLDVMPK